MRGTNDVNRKGKTIALFIDDIPEGVLIACYHCNQEFEDRSKYGTITKCPGCFKEVLYPAWAEW